MEKITPQIIPYPRRYQNGDVIMTITGKNFEGLVEG